MADRSGGGPPQKGSKGAIPKTPRPVPIPGSAPYPGRNPPHSNLPSIPQPPGRPHNAAPPPYQPQTTYTDGYPPGPPSTSRPPRDLPQNNPSSSVAKAHGSYSTAPIEHTQQRTACDRPPTPKWKAASEEKKKKKKKSRKRRLQKELLERLVSGHKRSHKKSKKKSKKSSSSSSDSESSESESSSSTSDSSDSSRHVQPERKKHRSPSPTFSRMSEESYTAPIQNPQVYKAFTFFHKTMKLTALC